MTQKSTIDIQSADNELFTPPPSRKFFRIPVHEKECISVYMKGEIYQVTDISLEGVCLFFDDKIDSEAARLLDGSGLIIKGCELIFPEIRIRNLTAKIIRFAPVSHDKWENGVQWINLDDDSRKKIAAQISKLKQNFMGSNE